MASLTPITGQLGPDRAAHLLRRATFGPTKAEIDNFASLTITEALNSLLTPLSAPEAPIDAKTGSNWLPKPVEDTNSEDSTLFDYFKAWFLELMRTRGGNLTEKMVFFLHSHLPADYSLIRNATSLYYQNALYRIYALGNFRELFAKVCVDNAMLLYIDNTLNDKDNPNENFAREMLELYSIGKGPEAGADDYTNYTEDDVKAAARVLTGIKHDFEFEVPDSDGYNGTTTDLPRGKVTINNGVADRHDPGTKTFSYRFDTTNIAPREDLMLNGFATEEGFFEELNQMLDMIFDKDETARFICRKLYRFFVYYKITEEIEQDIIAPLANDFKASNYDLSTLLTALLSSQHFFDEDNVATTDDHIGAIIKSPIDLVIGTLRLFEIDMPTDINDLYDVAYAGGILGYLNNQGMKFYEPIDVAGYPAYHQIPAFNRNWITPNWLARRYQFSEQIITGVQNESNQLVYKLDSVAFVEANIAQASISNARSLLMDLVTLMFPKSLPTDRFEYFLNTIFLDGHLESHWTDEWTNYTSTSNDDVVRGMLDNLIKRMIQSPEYQLF